MSEIKKHVVRQGECFHSIAAMYGVDWQALYDHADNAGLKALRPKPGVLAPGDIVVVEHDPAGASFSAGSTQRYRARIPLAPYSVTVKDADGNALDGKAYKLKVGAKVFEGTASGGVIEHDIPATAREAFLEIEAPGAPGGKLTMHLQIGALDPVDRMSGVKARLGNLGFPCPAGAGPDLDAGTRHALELFQAKVGLPVTGELDDDTRQRLENVHAGEE